MLCPVNECGVRVCVQIQTAHYLMNLFHSFKVAFFKTKIPLQKFVSSTIRPSKMGNDEIYDLQSAANFVADFFEYMPLENSTQIVRLSSLC